MVKGGKGENQIYEQFKGKIFIHSLYLPQNSKYFLLFCVKISLKYHLIKIGGCTVLQHCVVG